MKLTSKYDLISAMPQPGGLASLWFSNGLAQEAATAIDAGSGPGVPDSEGTPTPGVIEPGHVVTMNSSGNWDLATSPTLGTPALPLLMGVVHSGDDDFDGAYLGKLVVLSGPVEILTDKVTGSSFPIGTNLTVTAGRFVTEVTASSTIQRVGYVGAQGFKNGVLHVIFKP